MTVSSSPLFAGIVLRGWFPLWLALALMVLAVAGVFAVYLFEAGRVPLLVRLLMASLRASAIALILFLVLHPVVNFETMSEKPRSIVLLVDDSESMQTRDIRASFAERYRVAVAWDRVSHTEPVPENPSGSSLPDDLPTKPSRLEVMQKLLVHPKLKLLEAWGKVGPVQPSRFGLRGRGLDSQTTEWIENLKGMEPRTALAESAFDIFRRGENELPAAIILMTDGRDNASERGLADLARECQRREVPLYVIGLGGSTSSLLQIRDAAVPDTLFVEDMVSIPIRYRAVGAAGGRVVIRTTLNGEEVAKKTIDAVDGDNLREVLLFEPTRAQAALGRVELTTTITVFNGTDSQEDKLTRTVRVIDQKVKVLVVEASPRWDYKFLQRALLRDRRVEASFFLFDGDPRAMKSGPPFIDAFPSTRPELFKYDLLIVGDISATLLSREQQEMIREFVAEGGGFLHIAGRHRGPASFVGTPIADVLPVELEAAKFPLDAARPAGFRPELTPAGIRSPMLSLDDDPVANLRLWPTLPEMFWHYPVKKLKPAADVYLQHPQAKMADGQPMPLLAVHYYGKGFSTFIAFDETWRWRYNEADRLFGRFWSQAVYVAGVPRSLGTKLTQLALDTPDPLLDRTGTLYARLLTPELRPVTAARLTARLEWLDAKPGDADRVRTVNLQSLPGQPGEYIASVPFDRLGRFALKVDNGSDAALLEYRTNRPTGHELAPGGLAEEEMRKLATDAGGKFYQEETVHQLAGDLKAKTVIDGRQQSFDLWNWFSLVLILALFALEWIVRKFWSMS